MVQVVEVVEKAKAAKEVKERTNIPKLGVNQTDQEWEIWKSSWAGYKRDTSLMDQREAVYSLWGCLTLKLEMLAFDDKLDKNAYLDKD